MKFTVTLCVLLTLALTTTADEPEAVVTLTAENFDDFINEHEFSVVEFYAPWCGHCKKLAPEYEKAAKELLGKVPLAKVDASEETALASRFEVQGYPTIKVFRKGVPEEYKGGRTTESIIQYVEKMTRPAVTELGTEAELEALSENNPVIFVGKLKSKDSTALKVFTDVANKLRSKAVFVVIYDPSYNDIVYVHRSEEGITDTHHNIKETDELYNFCESERLPLFGPINAINFSEYFDAKKILVWFSGTEEHFKEASPAIKKTALEFRDKYSFVWLDIAEFKEHAENILGSSDFPSLVIQTDEGRYIYPQTTFDNEKPIIEFFNNVADGKIEKSLMSEPIPDVNDEPVKIVVGKSFEDLVLQKDKDVLLEVYAPWCGHCKNLEPIYEEVAKSLIDNKHLVIAKMDGTKNESPNVNFKWTGFPTLFFVKAGTDEPINFTGARTKEALLEFIKEHSTKALDTESPKDEL